MAKYTADQSLIRGAGRVAQSLRPVDLSGLDPMIEKGQKMMDIAIAEKKAVEKAFEAATNGVIMTSGALGDEFYNYTTDKVNGWRDMYYEGVRIGGTDGEKMKMDAMMQMQNWSTFVQNHKQWNIDYAETKKEDMLSSYMSIDDKHDITQILDKKYTLGENADGEMIFNITGRDGVQKQLTHAQYEDLMVIKNYSVDKRYNEVFDNNLKTRIFNYNTTLAQIRESIPTDTKQLGAAMTDGVMGGQSLEKMLRSSKSLDNEILAAIAGEDFMKTIGNKDAVLDPDEKAAFIDVIVNPKNPMFDGEVSRQIMAEQLTNDLQRRHKEAWDENDRVKRIGKYTPLNKEKQRDTMPVNYGVGYITTKSAELFVNDIKNKELEVIGPDGSQYEFDTSINQYVELTKNEETGEIIKTPITNKKMLMKAGIWGQSTRYRIPNFKVNVDDILNTATDKSILDKLPEDIEETKKEKELEKEKLKDEGMTETTMQ